MFVFEPCKARMTPFVLIIIFALCSLLSVNNGDSRWGWLFNFLLIYGGWTLNSDTVS